MNTNNLSLYSLMLIWPKRLPVARWTMTVYRRSCGWILLNMLLKRKKILTSKWGGLLWSCDPVCLHFRAMKFLSDCEFLKIEDILPFFPDFVTIDQFKVLSCGHCTDHAISDHVIHFRRQFVNHWRSITHTLRISKLKWRWVWLIARCVIM